MTFTTTTKTSIPVLAFHIEEGAKVRIQIGPSVAELDQEQREGLAAYLLKENN